MLSPAFAQIDAVAGDASNDSSGVKTTQVELSDVSGAETNPEVSSSDVNIDEATDGASDKVETKTLLYSILDVPPVHQCLLLGFQHFITMMSSTAVLPTLLFGGLCIRQYGDQSAVISSTFFVMGLATLLQTILGSRLPIIQGASAAFFVPTFTILASSQLPECPINAVGNASINSSNGTTGPDDISSQVWMERISYIGGTLAVSSLFQVFLGTTGLTSVMVRYLGPLVIAPTICIIGVSLVPVAAANASGNWYIAMLVCLLIILFSYGLDWVTVPMPTIKRKRLTTVPFPLFKSFPVLFSVGISWALCFILTVTGVFPEDSATWSYAARTDVRSGAFSEAAWFRMPYPGQFGLPRIFGTGILGMMAAVTVSVVESIGDYLAAARLSGAPKPPMHAINRGVMFEGISCILAGVFGVPTGTTSYSQNIGAIGITQVGSRRVIQFSAAFMLFFGVCPKIGAVFVSLPQPVAAGIFLSTFGMVAGVGLSSLQFANMSNQRNVFIVGYSIVLGLSVPYWLRMPNSSGDGDTMADGIAEGSAGSNVAARIILETILTLLKNEIFVTGFTAFVLDNSLRGSRADRGLVQSDKDGVLDGDTSHDITGESRKRLRELDCYDLPFGARIFGGRCRWTRHLPFLPDYSTAS